MKKIIIIFCLLLNGIAFSSNNYKEIYNNYVRDLKNIQTFGYKATLENGFDFSEGERIHCKGKFAILGEGFFKLLGNDGKTYYTRNGDFTYKNNTYNLYGECFVVQEFNKNGKTVLYKPTSNSKILREEFHNEIFIFSDTVEVNSEVCENQIELSNTNPLKVLDKMEKILSQNNIEQEVKGRLDTIEILRRHIIFNEFNKQKILTEYFNTPQIKNYLDSDIQNYGFLKEKFWYKWLTESVYILCYLQL